MWSVDGNVPAKFFLSGRILRTTAAAVSLYRLSVCLPSRSYSSASKEEMAMCRGGRNQFNCFSAPIKCLTRTPSLGTLETWPYPGKRLLNVRPCSFCLAESPRMDHSFPSTHPACLAGWHPRRYRRTLLARTLGKLLPNVGRCRHFCHCCVILTEKEFHSISGCPTSWLVTKCLLELHGQHLSF